MAADVAPVGSCYVHQDAPVSLLFLHEHHKHPQAYGGSDDPANLIYLCTGCHDLLHRLATMLMSGKGGQVSDALSLYLPNSPAARERLLGLVREVVRAKASFRAELASAEDPDDAAPIDVTLSLPRTIHAALKTMSQDYVHRSGRKSGLAAYLVAVLTHHANSGGAVAEAQPKAVLPQRTRRL